MADISMCEGQGCPLKDTCYRHTAPPTLHWQAYFCEPPYNKEEKNCTSYWDNAEYKRKE